MNQSSAITNRLYSPINTAPAISNTVAKMQACLTVSTFDPTEVPNELATSLAPIPNAKTNAVRKPRTTSHSTSGEEGSSVNRLCGVDCTASMVRSVGLTQTLTILPGPRHSPPYKVFSLTSRPSMACGPQVLLSPAIILFISNITAFFPSPELAFVKYWRSGTQQISNNSQIFFFLLQK